MILIKDFYKIYPFDLSEQKELRLLVAILKILISSRACFETRIDHRPSLESNLFNHDCLSVFRREYIFFIAFLCLNSSFSAAT